MIKSLATVKIWMQWSSAPIYPCGSADYEEAREEDLSDSQTQQLIATPPPAPPLFLKFPSGQYVAKNNCTRRIRDGKEWERTGKPLISLGGCNFRKGKYLAFCR